MNFVFVSNYINHHQIPFCNAMVQETDGNFTFIQTEPMEQERVLMGWHEEIRPSYVKCYYEEEAVCRERIDSADVVLFGGTDDEHYIEKRLKDGKLVVRYSERLYKDGQWKAISPRGLYRKYQDHTRYRHSNVYLLCSGAYVPSDFHIVRAYPCKMYAWGYFPETKYMDIDKLMSDKSQEKETVRILWAARMIDWKHPELAVQSAGYLKKAGLDFHLTMVGDGILREEIQAMIAGEGLEDCVSLTGAIRPEEVRLRMEQADIFLFTSDRKEGWGAVLNESMNSGCAVVADHMIGATPWLVQHGINGFAYEDGNSQSLFELTKKLVEDRELRHRMGRAAYDAITKVWNAESAAKNLMQLVRGWMEDAARDDGGGIPGRINATGNMDDLYPGAPAPVISERKMLKNIYKKRE
ncbi:MAG: glycosyltransferase family 4 protein [Acetatifactor sp.]|nr:glycosyltransferase family 4 protein [Acetatifactor sp.]